MPRLSTLVRHGANRVLNRFGLALGTTVQQRTTLQALARRTFSAPFLHGFPIDDDRHREFLRTVCLPLKHELEGIPVRPNDGQAEYYLDNVWFGPVDADVLYSIIRAYRPRRVVEVGSGFSTRLMRRAIRAGGLETHLVCIDPEPRVTIEPYADEFIRSPLEHLDPSRITDQLGPNDVLFIDSSHIISSGGDVVRLCLEFIPRIKAGVLIHFHDMFLPYDYPLNWQAQWARDEMPPWTEQYLVHALLVGNREFEIVWPSRYMWEQHRPELLEVFPHASVIRPSGSPPTSLWLRKLES